MVIDHLQSQLFMVTCNVVECQQSKIDLVYHLNYEFLPTSLFSFLDTLRRTHKAVHSLCEDLTVLLLTSETPSKKNKFRKCINITVILSCSQNYCQSPAVIENLIYALWPVRTENSTELWLKVFCLNCKTVSNGLVHLFTSSTWILIYSLHEESLLELLSAPKLHHVWLFMYKVRWMESIRSPSGCISQWFDRSLWICSFVV